MSVTLVKVIWGLSVSAIGLLIWLGLNQILPSNILMRIIGMSITALLVGVYGTLLAMCLGSLVSDTKKIKKQELIKQGRIAKITQS